MPFLWVFVHVVRHWRLFCKTLLLFRATCWWKLRSKRTPPPHTLVLLFPRPYTATTSFDFSPTVIDKLVAERRSCDRKKLDEGVEFRVRSTVDAR